MSAPLPKFTTARKVHRCDCCHFPIYIGERYKSLTTKPWDHWDNEGFDHFKFCRFCWESDPFPAEDDGTYNAYLLEAILDCWLGRWMSQNPSGPSFWAASFSDVWEDLNEARQAAWKELEA